MVTLSTHFVRLFDRRGTEIVPFEVNLGGEVIADWLVVVGATCDSIVRFVA